MSKLKDLTGQKFGRLTVIERAKNDKHNRTTWLCRCDCGNEKIISSVSLQKQKSCGCLRSEKSTLKRGENIYRLGTTVAVLRISSEKYGTKEFLFDMEDYEKVKVHHWGIRLYRKYFYAYTHIGNHKYIALHRFIIDCPDNMMVDHIDHCTFNNRKENLKICTNKENQHNRRGIEGIKKTKWGYQVLMRTNGKLKCFGTYKTLEEAKQVRINAEKMYRPYVKEIGKYGK